MKQTASSAMGGRTDELQTIRANLSTDFYFVLNGAAVLRVGSRVPAGFSLSHRNSGTVYSY
ncbi:hypothetical protein [Terriglobus sp. TAA 43]|uniref:hypothetical protein n=1 Tax=Terriglobus sp. TAA 43 TaxID=278961 RepID=UPI00064702CF|nr:hypothetical protein [Terriglobus sp. TAA 43]